MDVLFTEIDCSHDNEDALKIREQYNVVSFPTVIMTIDNEMRIIYDDEFTKKNKFVYWFK